MPLFGSLSLSAESCCTAGLGEVSAVIGAFGATGALGLADFGCLASGSELTGCESGDGVTILLFISDDGFEEVRGDIDGAVLGRCEELEFLFCV